ncbi:MAG: hypothetical protein PCFJNLEI_03707 [Verrucomicrobiae bacterium]|nr:hypothetical protein [Verrucomicrobiae bacterium]
MNKTILQLLTVLALGTATVAAEKPRGLTGPYGFLSSAVMGPQAEETIRTRIATMARDYGIREFQFYDWFADYSTPVAGDHWPTPYFQKGRIDRRTIEISIDEIHRQGGRAWAYVQAIGSDEKDLEDPQQDIWKLRNAAGQWHWHPPGAEKPRFPTYFANAAWAKHMVSRWARRVKQLGFDGIHWDTLGKIAGDYGAETAGIHAFLKTARPLLARHGLRQTMNLVDMAWWDRAIVREQLEFPYVESWSDATTKRYYAEMDHSEMAGTRGVLAMYATVAVPAGQTAAEVICARHAEAQRHNLVYLIVGDGARRMKTEYWPDTVPLNEAENACLQVVP